MRLNYEQQKEKERIKAGLRVAVAILKTSDVIHVIEKKLNHGIVTAITYEPFSTIEHVWNQAVELATKISPELADLESGVSFELFTTDGMKSSRPG